MFFEVYYKVSGNCENVSLLRTRLGLHTSNADELIIDDWRDTQMGQLLSFSSKEYAVIGTT